MVNSVKEWGTLQLAGGMPTLKPPLVYFALCTSLYRGLLKGGQSLGQAKEAAGIQLWSVR